MEWFESWFDSPYYHILYQHRNNKEAELFIDNLYTKLNIQPTDKILDLACGAGRHSLYMAGKGNHVTGIDLSSNSITEAKKKALALNLDTKVNFQVADMRSFSLGLPFDVVLNLFTSFGYFDNKKENSKVIESVAQHQNTGGILVIDYLNSQLVRSKGEEKSTKIISNIEFKTHKYFLDDFVIKEIEVNDGGNKLYFREQVQLFEKEEIEDILIQFGYCITGIYGDYLLNPYRLNADRNIIISQKKATSN